MNREDTKTAIAVMQAYVDGEEIEERKVLNPDGWHAYPKRSGVLFNFELYEYRVRKKPQTYWLCTKPDFSGAYIWTTGEPPVSDDWIKVREVIE